MRIASVLGVCVGVLFSSSLMAEDTFFSESGLRFGMGDDARKDFKSYEFYGAIDTPWSWDVAGSVSVEMDLEAALGLLYGDAEAAGYVRIAPSFEFLLSDYPVSFIFSSGPSFYSENTYGDYDMGGNFHFTTSIGVAWHCCENWSLSYRLQHTSNANLDDPNPGLDMHVVGISYRF